MKISVRRTVRLKNAMPPRQGRSAEDHEDDRLEEERVFEVRSRRHPAKPASMMPVITAKTQRRAYAPIHTVVVLTRARSVARGSESGGGQLVGRRTSALRRKLIRTATNSDSRLPTAAKVRGRSCRTWGM